MTFSRHGMLGGDQMRRYLAAVGVASLAMLTSLGALVAPAQAASTGTVSILHAVPGLTVDVYANGQKLSRTSSRAR